MVHFFPLVGKVRIGWLIGVLVVVIFVNPSVVKTRSAGPQAGDWVGIIRQRRCAFPIRMEGRSRGQHKRLVVHHGLSQCILWRFNEQGMFYTLYLC